MSIEKCKVDIPVDIIEKTMNNPRRYSQMRPHRVFSTKLARHGLYGKHQRSRTQKHPKSLRRSISCYSSDDENDWKGQVDRLRIFIIYERERQTFEVSNEETIKELKDRTKEAFSITSGQEALDETMKDQRILTLTYAGAQLADHWSLSDVGVPNGSTLHAAFSLQVKPSLYILCVFNEEVIPILDKLDMRTTTGAALRGLVSREIGIPVTVFRLSTLDRKEIYDSNVLGDFGVKIRDTLRLDVWDGWKEFLNLCIMGFTRHVMSHLPSDDVMARFYQKVALYVAAHFAHVDLAITLLKQGIRADEPIGEHPMRQWCKHGGGLHIDAHKAPVHEAAEAGSLSVLRSFVHSSVCNVLAKDGNNLTPLNLALRKKQKACASFLLTKQWNKISYSKSASLNLSIYVKMKRWAERSRGKVLMLHGQWKSSIKNPKKHIQIGALLGQGVQLDGFTKSRMTTMPEADYQREQDEERQRKERLYANPIPPEMDPDVYFKSMRRAQDKFSLPQLNKFSNILQKASKESEKESISDKSSDVLEQSDVEVSGLEDTRNPAQRPRSQSHGGMRLPPITEQHQASISASQQNLSTLNLDDTEFGPTRRPRRPTLANDSKTASQPTRNTNIEDQEFNGRQRRPTLANDSKTTSQQTRNTNNEDQEFNSRQRRPTMVNEPKATSQQPRNMTNDDQEFNSRQRRPTMVNEPKATSRNMTNEDQELTNRGRRPTMVNDLKSNFQPRKQSVLKHTQSSHSLFDSKATVTSEEETASRRKKKDKEERSAVPLAKVKTEGGSIPLTMGGGDGLARPFIRAQSQHLTKDTLNLYEKYRGLGSRDYAVKCLTVANSFSEKPWLLQVQQALTISQHGVKKALNKKPHLFSPREEESPGAEKLLATLGKEGAGAGAGAGTGAVSAQ